MITRTIETATSRKKNVRRRIGDFDLRRGEGLRLLATLELNSGSKEESIDMKEVYDSELSAHEQDELLYMKKSSTQ